jgi:PAS domain S-box-containing protein
MKAVKMPQPCLNAPARNGTWLKDSDLNLRAAEPSFPPDLKSQLAAIVEFSNDAIFSRTFGGTITTWNAGAERMFGYAAGEIIGRSSRVLLPPGRREEYRELLKRMRAGQPVQHFETDRVRKDGRLLQVSLALSPVRDSSGRLIGISTIARDITEQRRMREALARSQRELTDLFEEASVGLMWISANGTVLRANRALLSLLHCRPSQCLDHPLSRFHADGEVIADLLARLAGRQTLRNLATELRTAHGEIKPVLMDANAFWENGQLVHSRWFVRDISQRKRLEREVLELSDRERRSFAQELHDGLGQQLGGIAYLANVLHERLAESRLPEADEAARIFTLVRNAIEQTRRLARGLSPIRPEPEGLTDALNELAAQTREVFRVDCQFKRQGSVLVEDFVLAGHFYRIAQEAVNNALKHAAAHQIEIRLSGDPKRLTLAVRDDGKGIGPLSPRRSGLGLRIMQYRADLVRGRLMVGPRPDGRGTEVSCTAPRVNATGRAI